MRTHGTNVATLSKNIDALSWGCLEYFMAEGGGMCPHESFYSVESVTAGRLGHRALAGFRLLQCATPMKLNADAVEERSSQAYSEWLTTNS